MYEDFAQELERVLKLVESCPELLREKAFEILLQGYVNTVAPGPRPRLPIPPEPLRAAPPPDPTWREGVPEEVVPRLQAMAQRLSVQTEKLAGLFDFSSDPFSYAPLNVAGKSRTWCARGGGIRATSLSISSRGSNTTWVVPSRQPCRRR